MSEFLQGVCFLLITVLPGDLRYSIESTARSLPVPETNPGTEGSVRGKRPRLHSFRVSSRFVYPTEGGPGDRVTGHSLGPSEMNL